MTRIYPLCPIGHWRRFCSFALLYVELSSAKFLYKPCAFPFVTWRPISLSTLFSEWPIRFQNALASGSDRVHRI